MAKILLFACYVNSIFMIIALLTMSFNVGQNHIYYIIVPILAIAISIIIKYIFGTAKLLA